MLDFNPQLIIDETGIKTKTTTFQYWNDIKNEEIIVEGYGKSRTFYLIYEYPNGFEKLNIDAFNKTPKQLENLIRTYRIRNNNYKRRGFRRPHQEKSFKIFYKREY